MRLGLLFLFIFLLKVFFCKIQWNASVKATQDGGLSKEVVCHQGKMGQVMKVWLSGYLVLLSFEKPGNKTATPSWPNPIKHDL